MSDTAEDVGNGLNMKMDKDKLEDYEQIVKNQRQFVRTNQPASLEHRRQQLKRLRKLITKNEDLLLEAVYKDLRRDRHSTKVLELLPALGEIDYCLANLKNWSKNEFVEKTFTTMLDTPMIVKEPLGVILLISPWNYPILMILLPMITMIAAGNTVVIKPSELAPRTSKLISNLFTDYFDKQFIKVVEGGVMETTELLKQKFDLIFYTGNGSVGKIILKAAAEHLTPTVLELGGKNPAVILPDADIPITARRLVWGKFMNNGQTCLSPDYILCTADIKEQLVHEIQSAIHDFYGQDCQLSKDYSRIINERHFDRIKSIIDRTKARTIGKFGELDRDDVFIPPHIFELESTDDILMQDELFGPLLPILTADNLDSAIEFLSDKEKPLAMYLFTRSEASVKKFLESTRSGAVTINDVVLHITVDTLPFGGVGTSGFGAYHGKFGFDQFSHKKAVLKRGFFGEGLGSVRYPPMTERKVNHLQKLAVRRSLPTFVQQLISVWPLILVSLLIGLVCGHFAQKC